MIAQGVTTTALHGRRCVGTHAEQRLEVDGVFRRERVLFSLTWMLRGASSRNRINNFPPQNASR